MRKSFRPVFVFLFIRTILLLLFFYWTLFTRNTHTVQKKSLDYGKSFLSQPFNIFMHKNAHFLRKKFYFCRREKKMFSWLQADQSENLVSKFQFFFFRNNTEKKTIISFSLWTLIVAEWVRWRNKTALDNRLSVKEDDVISSNLS